MVVVYAIWLFRHFIDVAHALWSCRSPSLEVQVCVSVFVLGAFYLLLFEFCMRINERILLFAAGRSIAETIYPDTGILFNLTSNFIFCLFVKLL